MNTKTILVVGALSLIAACGDMGTEMPAVAPQAEATPVTTSTANGDIVTLSADVQPIFDKHCISCHSGAGASAGMSLAEGDAYANVVNVASQTDSTMVRVAPGDPENSVLVQKVVSGEMPLTGSLTDDEIATIKQWVADGACLDAETCP